MTLGTAPFETPTKSLSNGKRPLLPREVDPQSDNEYPESDNDGQGAQGQGAAEEGQGGGGNTEVEQWMLSHPANLPGASGGRASASASGNNKTTSVSPKVVVALAVLQNDIKGMVMYMSDGTDTYSHLKKEATKRCNGRTSQEIGQEVQKFHRGAGLQQRKVNPQGYKWKGWHMTDMTHYPLSVRELKDMYESGGKMWFDIEGVPPCVDPQKKAKWEEDMKKLMPDFTLDQIRVMEVESD